MSSRLQAQSKTAIRRALTGVLIAHICGAVAASAQDRPYRSLFGGAGNDPAARQTLGVAISLAEAYDTNVLAERTQTTSRLQLGGTFTALSGDLRYALRGKRAQLTATLSSNARYFSAVHELAALRHSLGVGATLPIGQKTTVLLDQSLSYAPSYLFGLFAKALPPAVGQGIASASDYAVSDRTSYTSESHARFSRSVSRRGTLDFSAGYRHTDFSGGAASLSDLSGYDAGGHLGYGLGRDAVLRIGYDYRQAQYASGLRPVQHDIGLGLDYDRPLTRSRRTRLAFSFGSSVIDGPPPTGVAGPSVRQLRAVGNVLLTHQIGRTWSARAAYRRAPQFVEDLSAPVFTDAVTLTADGFVNRRTDVTASVAYSSGALIGRADSTFETYTGTARVRVGLNKSIAAFGEYIYYFYDFHRGVQLTSGLPPRVGRNGVRVGLTLWMPLIRN